MPTRRVRWYDPYLNRWIQPDTIVPEAAQGVQAWDRFAYTNNNLVLYNDPTGHAVACGETREAGACGGENGETRYNEEHEWNSSCQNGTGDYCPKYGELAICVIFAIVAPETVLHLIISCATGNCSGNESTQPQDLSNAIEYPSAPPGSKGTYQSPYGYPTDPTKAPAEGLKWEPPNMDPASGKGSW